MKKNEIKNRDKIEYPKLILECIELGIAIQNKEIATVFVYVSGHISDLSIKLYAPSWLANANADYSNQFMNKAALENTVTTLKKILNNGVEAIPGFSEKRERERQRKIKEIAKLQSEIREVEL